MRPAKTPISLSIHPVWLESSLFVSRSFCSLASHLVHNEDSDQTGGDAQADQSLCWAHSSFCWFCCAQAQYPYLHGPWLQIWEPQRLSAQYTESIFRIFYESLCGNWVDIGL